MKLSDIRVNPKNPRIIKDDKFRKLAKSLKEFPQMMELRPIIVDDDGIIQGGNMRYKALRELGYSEVPDEWVKQGRDLTPEQWREFVVKDNLGYGEWDYDMIANEYSNDLLTEWGLDLPLNDPEELEKQIAKQKLQDAFIVPPFSVLDTRQGYWEQRKQYWLKIIDNYEESRENTLSKGKIDKYKPGEANNGTSIFDPVLAEIIQYWFGLKNCNVIDPFAGGTFGYVSSYLGNYFTGIELRKEQADINNDRIKEFKNSRYICDDGQNINNHIAENSQDLLFSCPPYFNLEIYSDLPNDASNQKEYSNFIKILDNAFTRAINCLKENRFAVIVVGDIRDNKGYYRRFADSIKDIFYNNKMLLYNELILINKIGNAAMRAENQMKNRKPVKVHQNILVFYKGDGKKPKIKSAHENVLVFYKGDPAQIKNIYPKIEVEQPEFIE